MGYIFRVSEHYNEANGIVLIREKYFYELEEANGCFEKWVSEKDSERKNKDLSLSTPHVRFMQDEDVIKEVEWGNGYQIDTLERIEVY